MSGAEGACEAFEVDITASVFGSCKCGFVKVEHSDAAQTASPPLSRKSSTRNEVAEAAQDKPTPAPRVDDGSEDESGQGHGACEAFEVDITASVFGSCKCGFVKGDHSEVAQTATPPLSRKSSAMQMVPEPAAEPERTQPAPTPARRPAAPESDVSSMPVAMGHEVDEATEDDVADEDVASSGASSPCNGYVVDMAGKLVRN